MTCIAPCPGVELLDQSAFTTLAGEWNGLLARSYDNRLFFTPDWHRLWWHQFGDGEASVFAFRTDGDLRAVLPLQVRVVDGRRTVSLAGDPEVTDYMDATADRAEAPELLASLWECAFQELAPERIVLRHVPSSSPLIGVTRDAAEARGLHVTLAQDTVCPVAILCSTWDGYLQTLTKKQRHEVRRKLRRAQDGAQWEWVTAQSADDLDRMLPAFFRLHELSAHEKARFMTPEIRSFFGAVARHLLAADRLRLSIFRRDGADLAATMSFVYRDRYLLYNSGYDPAGAAHSPGIAAVAHAMQDAIAEEAVAFDFLSGDEPYKYQMGGQDTLTCVLVAE